MEQRRSRLQSMVDKVYGVGTPEADDLLRAGDLAMDVIDYTLDSIWEVMNHLPASRESMGYYVKSKLLSEEED